MSSFEVEVLESYYRRTGAQSRLRLRLHQLSGTLPNPNASESAQVLRELAVRALRACPEPRLVEALPTDEKGRRPSVSRVDRTASTLTIAVVLLADVRKVLSAGMTWTCAAEKARGDGTWATPGDPSAPQRPD